jgi:hypothetical protein
MNSTRVAYFDCFSGISGDMVLGGLVDAGADLRAIESELRKLGLDGWKISAEKVKRGAISATRVKVETHDDPHAGHHHHHRGLSEILRMIEQAKLAPRAAERAGKIFTRLGHAEAKVHQVPIEKVHFHEVGAVDSIVDIVGSAIGFELLGIDEFACSEFDVGRGTVKTEHGLLPVPAPATTELLYGAPAYSSGIEHELVTPTGAAIATTLSTHFGGMPAMTLRAVGYGAGSTEIPEKPNVLRIMIGESPEIETADYWGQPVSVVEANIDDMNPQVYGHFVEHVLAAGALDVFSTPAQMKKNRPGLLISLVCNSADATRMIDLVFRETTTIGVRKYDVQRKTLDREIVIVETPLGPIRMKVSSLNGSVLNAAPEYEDCHKIALERGLPLKQVIATASFEFQKQSEKLK